MNKNHFETILKNYHLHIPLLDFVQKLTASTKNCDISSFTSVMDHFMCCPNSTSHINLLLD